MDRWLENNLVVKIISVVLAVIIWLQVAGAGPLATQTQTPVNGVSVSARNVPDGLSVTSITPPTVTVRLRGPNKLVQGVAAGSLAATVDLTKASAGRLQFPVAATVPNGVTLIQVTPQDVTVVLEPVIDRKRTVEVHTTGEVAAGYKAGSPVSSPAQVILHGPESQVDKVASVTAAVGIGGATSDVSATLQPRALDAKGKPITDVTLVPSTIQVTVPVQPAVVTKAVTISVNVQGKPATGYKVSGAVATPSQVVLSGTPAALKGITQVSTVPVSVKGAKADVTKTVGIVLPDGVTSAQPNPVSVTVHITATH